MTTSMLCSISRMVASCSDVPDQSVRKCGNLTRRQTLRRLVQDQQFWLERQAHRDFQQIADGHRTLRTRQFPSA